jgi:DNA helicase II / ATP-dependent DNA helicase PcrA
LLLAERDARRAGGATVPLPTRVAASRVKDMVDDPAAAAAALRRPMPRRPFPQTRLGTRFHAWVEDRALSPAPGELDAADWQLDVEEDDGDADRLGALQRTFEASEWGSRSPAAVELELHVVLGGTVFVCKLDAVYDVAATGSPFDVQIVDWKTGKPPRDARDVEARQIQLAFYRLAYARWRGIDPARVDAVFYFVGDDLVVRPDRVYDEEELVRLWSSVAGVPSSPGAGSGAGGTRSSGSSSTSGA